jgi:hypothetical protein
MSILKRPIDLVQDSNVFPFVPRLFEPLRSKKLGDDRLEYFCYFYQPKNGTIKRVQQLKALKYKEHLAPMVEVAVGRFCQLIDPNSFDAVVSVPSTSALVSILAQEFVKEFNLKRETDIRWYPNLLKKNLFSNVTVYPLGNEMSLRTSERIDAMKRQYADLHEEVEAKRIVASYRRYVFDWFRLGKNWTPERLKEEWANVKRVLLVDDTIGEGKTFTEVIRLLAEICPHVKFTCFVLVKDF